MAIEVYTEYTFMDNANSKYCLSVDDFSTYIKYLVYNKEELYY